MIIYEIDHAKPMHGDVFLMGFLNFYRQDGPLA